MHPLLVCTMVSQNSGIPLKSGIGTLSPGSIKVNSTNYFDVLIEVAEDTKATSGTVPPIRGTGKSVANYEYELVSKSPYKYTSDDIFFLVYAERNEISKSKKERELYFSKGRPCFRASPLTKTYGWGVHSNKDGKVAIFAVESKEYLKMLKDIKIEKRKAMRNSRK